MHTPTFILLGLAASCAASGLFEPKNSPAKRDGMTKTRCKKRNVGARGDSNGGGLLAAPLFTPTTNWNPKDDKSKDDKPAVEVKSVSAGASVSVDTSSLLAATSNFAGNWIKRNCVYWGWLPADYQKLDQNGQLETPKVADQITGTGAKYFGMYAHMYGNKYKQGDSSTYFDGKEILHWTDYLQGTGAIPVLSVMPVYGFNGMTKDDNTQAVALAKVVKHFADAGFEPYLRWGHEMNWYFHPNSDDDRTGASFYKGSAQDFIDAWKIVHDTVKAMVPNAKMYWCPIRAWDDNSNYAQYWPGAKYVDVVGVDYYPNTTDDYNQVAKYVQDIHDTYAKPYGYPFHIGETGTTLDASTKIHWADVITSKATCSALTNLNAVHWFDHYREMDGGDFRLLSDGGISNRFTSLMKYSS